MTAKEKAIELVNKYEPKIVYINNIECALICVDEILEIESNKIYSSEIGYWQEVKQEINKL